MIFYDRDSLFSLLSGIILEFPQKIGHTKKLEWHPDNTPKGFSDSKPNVFSACCRRFRYNQRWSSGLDLCCGMSSGEQAPFSMN